MLRNIILTTLRNFKKFPEYSIINILGLTTSLTIGILIFLFVQYESSYDNFHENKDRVYRIQQYIKSDNYEGTWSATTGFVVPAIVDRYSGIEHGIRVLRPSRTEQFKYEDEIYNEPNFIYADSMFFDVFTYEFIEGTPENALSETRNLVLTQNTAKKYFGDESAIGKIINADGRDYVVSAVIKNVPSNSHLPFDMVASMSDLRTRWPQLDVANGSRFYSYVMLEEGQNIEEFSKLANQGIFEINGYTTTGDDSNVPPDLEMKWIFQNIKDIHLSGNGEKEFSPNGDLRYVRIFGTVAIFILILASINYMNLASARSARRGKEVGLRKVLGAKKNSIFAQFIGEAFIIILLAGLISFALSYVLLGEFNTLTGKTIPYSHLISFELLSSLGFVIVLLSLLSGWYPAVILSNTEAINILKSNNTGLQGDKKSIYLRRGLVIFQFSISVLLITGTSIIRDQLNYIDSRDVGFDKSGLMVIKLPAQFNFSSITALKNALEENSIIENVSSTSGIPGERIPILPIRVPSLSAENQPENEDGDPSIIGIRMIFSDFNIGNTLKLNMADGRTFNNSKADENHAFLINEAAAKELNIEDPIGKSVEYFYNLDSPKTGQIVGVIKDFNYASVRNSVDPLLIQLGSNYQQFVNIRYSTNNSQDIINLAEETWKNVVPGLPFEYFFLDDHYNQIYRDEQSLGKVISYFTFLAIVIACLGLYGLASYLTEIKTREIGVRKVLGASVFSLVKLFSKEFIILILIANIVALYPTIHFMTDWLNGFSFKIDLSIYPFILSLGLAIIIAGFSIGIKIVKASTANPVKSIRME